MLDKRTLTNGCLVKWSMFFHNYSLLSPFRDSEYGHGLTAIALCSHLFGFLVFFLKSWSQPNKWIYICIYVQYIQFMRICMHIASEYTYIYAILIYIHMFIFKAILKLYAYCICVYIYICAYWKHQVVWLQQVKCAIQLFFCESFVEGCHHNSCLSQKKS